MADTGPAVVYLQAAPHAILLPEGRRACVGAAPEHAANPYEQIPLVGHDCGVPAEPPDPER